MAEPSPIAQLAELQQVDLDLERAGHEITALRAGLVDERAVQQAQALAASTAKAEQAAQLELREAEAALTDTEQRIKRNEQRLSSGAISTVKDLAAVEHELAFLRQSRGALDERVLVAMDALDAATQAAATAKAQRAQAEQDRAAEKIQQQARLVAAQERHVTLQAERAAAVVGVPSDLLARYDAIRKTRGKAVVLAQNGACQGCRVALQPPLLQKLRTSRNEIITCGNCGRILIAG